jgi:hypothetical protein
MMNSKNKMATKNLKKKGSKSQGILVALDDMKSSMARIVVALDEFKDDPEFQEKAQEKLSGMFAMFEMFHNSTKNEMDDDEAYSGDQINYKYRQKVVSSWKKDKKGGKKSVKSQKVITDDEIVRKMAERKQQIEDVQMRAAERRKLIEAKKAQLLIEDADADADGDSDSYESEDEVDLLEVMQHKRTMVLPMGK